MADINGIVNQAKQNIAQQQKIRNEINQNDTNLTNNVSGTLSSQINELGNEKSKQGTVILDLKNELNKTSDEVERKEIQGKLDDAQDFMKSLDDDIEKLNTKNKSANNLSKMVENGKNIQDELKQQYKTDFDENIAKHNKKTDAKKENVEVEDKSSDSKDSIKKTLTNTLTTLSSELNVSQMMLNKTQNGGK